MVTEREDSWDMRWGLGHERGIREWMSDAWVGVSVEDINVCVCGGK